MRTQTTISWEEFLAAGKEGQPVRYFSEKETFVLGMLPGFALDLNKLFEPL